MKKIITISRQYGCGGREIAKKLADSLGYAYYDKELIHEVAKQCGLSSDYIEKYNESNLTRFIPLTFGRAIATYQQSPSDTVFLEQAKVLHDIANNGNCVIVGHCADFILKDENPLKVFLYCSDMNYRIKRCKELDLTENKEDDAKIEKEILSIDKERSKYYDFYTGQKRGEVQNYNLCIDTSSLGIETTIEIIKQSLE